MAHNPGFRNNLIACLGTYGTNYSSSRLSNVQLEVYAKAEKYLAGWVGAEAALTVSSGLVAGQLVLKTLAGKGFIIYGPDTHPALWRTPADLITGDFASWTESLPENLAAIEESEVVIVSNSLDALRATPYSFSWVADLPQNKNYTLIIDDSHGFGVTGKNGAGIYGGLKNNLSGNVQLLVVSSFGKALGIPGGVVLSTQKLMEQVKNQAFYGGGSPVIPAYLGAFMQSEGLYQEARHQLQENICYFTSRLRYLPLFSSFPDYPVFYTIHNDLYEYLLDRGILISHFSYPTPNHPPITRVIINSLHTPADIDLLTQEINNYCVTKNLL